MDMVFDWTWRFLPAPMRDQLSGYAVAFWRALPQLILAILFLVGVWALVALATRTVPRALRGARMRGALQDVIVMLLTVGLWLLGGLIALTIAFPSVTPSKALTALGVGGVAIGFAFKDVFENFLAGILLLIREPFSKSDFIECQGIDGQVEEITVRDTHIRQTDGQLVVAPNAMFFKNPVTIRTATGLRRTTIIVGVAYGEDVDRAREVISEAVRQVDSVRDDVRDVQNLRAGIRFELDQLRGDLVDRLAARGHPPVARQGGRRGEARAGRDGNRDPLPLPNADLQAPPAPRPGDPRC